MSSSTTQTASNVEHREINSCVDTQVTVVYKSDARTRERRLEENNVRIPRKNLLRNKRKRLNKSSDEHQKKLCKIRDYMNVKPAREKKVVWL